MSRNFYNLLIIYRFFGFQIRPENGMVECWNIGFQKDISHFNFSAKPVGGGAINPTLHYPRTHYSTIPVFHHSPPPADERSELSSIVAVVTIFVPGFLLY